MVLFDIKLRPESTNMDNQIALYNPELQNLVMYKGGRKEFMRNKT